MQGAHDRGVCSTTGSSCACLFRGSPSSRCFLLRGYFLSVFKILEHFWEADRLEVIPLDNAWRSPLLPAPPACSAAASNSHDDAIFAWVSQAASSYPNVQMLDLNALICPEKRCEAARQGRIVFRDTRHITASYITSIGDAFARRISEAESRSAAAH